MASHRLVEEAKRIKERASELAEHVSEKGEEMKTLAATTAGEAREQLVEQAAGVKDAALTKVASVVDELNVALPVLRKAGYPLKGVEIELGVPPRVVGVFDAVAGVSQEEVDILARQNAGQRLTVLLLQTLSHSSILNERFRIGEMKVRELAVEIGLLPVVTVKIA
jgi:hypothetical protein